MISPRIALILSELGIEPEIIAVRELSEFEEATELDVAEVDVDGREHLLIPAACMAWKSMKAAALLEGIELNVVSAFRGVDRQSEIVRRKLATGASMADVLCVNAPPGFSEHHSGRAIDLTTPACRPLEVEFEQTAAFVWLRSRAGEFGFRLSYPQNNCLGYQYEPWHWYFYVS